MNKIVASVGLVALGASGLQSASAQALLGTPDTAKPWSVAATLRGFYDDNPSTTPKNSHPVDSFGFEVSPSANFALAMEQTKVNLGVLYTYKYYDTKPLGNADHADQTVTFNAGLQHTFNERFKVAVSDSFVLGQEPDLLRAGNSFATFQRISGDNIRNYGSVSLDGQLTPVVGIGAGYDNAFYDYKAKGAFFPTTGSVVASPSGALDRIENRAHLEGTFQVAPQTKALLGYQFTDISYTGDEIIGGDVRFTGFFSRAVFFPVMSKDRNLREHTVYVGAEHAFHEQLTGAVRVGGSYIDYYNDPNTSSSWAPYVNANLRYGYAPQSFIEAGVSYDVSATDIVGLNSANGTFTTDAEAATVYASVNHQITPRFFGSLLGQFQNSTYKGGTFNNVNEQFYLVGLDLEYRFTPNLSSHLGYNYDRLESSNTGGFNRSFDRNRVYIGITASY